MHQETNWPADKAERYQLMSSQLEALVAECPPVSALSNAAGLLWEALNDINWAGFYLLKGSMLHLGPFQGKPACTLIPVGRGVCGTSAATHQIQLVKDVLRHCFERILFPLGYFLFVKVIQSLFQSGYGLPV